MDCGSCPKLTIIPDNIIDYNYYNSPWISESKTRNIQKLITLQHFVKNNIKYWRFSRWIKSREFNEWIYHPDNIGGKMAKREIEKMFN